jgi:hypothetical protein
MRRASPTVSASETTPGNSRLYGEPAGLEVRRENDAIRGTAHADSELADGGELGDLLAHVAHDGARRRS